MTLTFEELRLKHKRRYDITGNDGFYTLIDFMWDVRGKAILENVSYEKLLDYLEEDVDNVD